MTEWLDFSNILNISIVAGWMVVAVIILRVVLRKTPKWIHVALWGLVAVRLIVPFSFESPFSLIPSIQTVPPEILRYEGEDLQDSVHLDVITNPIFSDDVSVQLGQTVDRMQVHMVNMTFVWLIGIAIMLLYTIISYWNLYRKVKTAVLYKNNIFQSEYVKSPFVLGFIKPRIYLSFHMKEQEMQHVVAHELAHMKRKDHWWKPLGFLLLTLHWFNPLIWLGYVLFCRDIELACDEKVIKELSTEYRADYSQALLNCSVNQHRIAACPLAFGEVGVKKRVKSVLNYKKPEFWMVSTGIVVSAIFAVCFLTNPVNETDNILDKILHADRSYEIIEKHDQKITLTIPVSKLPESIFTKEGQDFGEKDIVAYKDASTSIYLKRAQYANEGNDKLYFCFDFAFDLDKEQGSFYYSWKANGASSQNACNTADGILRADNAEFANAVKLRGLDGDGKIWLYVSTDALRQAEGTISFDIYINKIRYKKNSTARIVKTFQGNRITYHEMSDGTWQAGRRTYKYKLEIGGRMPNAMVDSRYVYLSNLEDITFEQAWKAAGLSSNTNDYFDVEDAVLVDCQ